MSDDHERIDELLAGYVLLALSGEDAAEADRLLVEHVPGCARCRQTLTEFESLTGDLALAPAPAEPPETLLPRLRRALEDGGAAAPRRARRAALVAVAASVVSLVAMGGLAMVLGSRLSEAETRTGTALEILSAIRSPGAQPVNVAPQGDTPPASGMVEVSAPDVRRLYLAADACPDPAPGHGYQLWLATDEEWVAVGELFWPDDGVVLLEVEVDVSRYDEIWITEEPVGAPPSTPTLEGGPSWRGTLP